MTRRAKLILKTRPEMHITQTSFIEISIEAGILSGEVGRALFTPGVGGFTQLECCGVQVRVSGLAQTPSRSCHGHGMASPGIISTHAVIAMAHYSSHQLIIHISKVGNAYSAY
jgi:hypothetical protein